MKSTQLLWSRRWEGEMLLLLDLEMDKPRETYPFDLAQGIEEPSAKTHRRETTHIQLQSFPGSRNLRARRC